MMVSLEFYYDSLEILCMANKLVDGLVEDVHVAIEVNKGYWDQDGAVCNVNLNEGGGDWGWRYGLITILVREISSFI